MYFHFSIRPCDNNCSCVNAASRNDFHLTVLNVNNRTAEPVIFDSLNYMFNEKRRCDDTNQHHDRLEGGMRQFINLLWVCWLVRFALFYRGTIIDKCV